MVTDEVERLCDLHDDDGNDGEGDADDVHFPTHILGAEAEHAHDAGREQHECDERDRQQRDPVEHLVGEGADLEQGVPGAHVVCVQGLREGEHKEGRRAALFGGQPEAVARNAVACQGKGGKHTALKHDLNAVTVCKDTLFSWNAACDP